MAKVGEKITTAQEAIIKRIAFFDIFDFPLTVFELWKDGGIGLSLRELRQVLDSDPRLETADGFYFLAGRPAIVATRRERHNYSERKIRIARHFTRAFALWPGIRLVALANSIGRRNLRDGSDIDFFIITAPGLIWLSRLYCTGLAKILGRRPTARTKRDRICLSFYLAADRLAIEDLKLAGSDPYFEEWRRNLVPLYNINQTYEAFAAANAGVASRGAEISPQQGGWLEKMAQSWQLNIMPPDLKEANGQSDGVIIKTGVLKFYQRDRRREIAQKYAQKISILLR